MSPVQVIVAGAGIGGLALAQGLRSAGVEVAVFEKDAGAAFRNQGYRIRVNGDGIRALRNLLAPSAFELFAATAGTPGGGMDTLDHSLRRLHAQTLPDDPDLPGGGHLAVNRRTLREILLSGLEDAVSYSARLTHYTSAQGGGVTAYFADGRTASGDVLIGADGVSSAVRAQLMPEASVMDATARSRWRAPTRKPWSRRTSSACGPLSPARTNASSAWPRSSTASRWAPRQPGTPPASRCPKTTTI